MKLHINALETVINDLSFKYEATASQLRPETNATPVEPKEKSDLEETVQAYNEYKTIKNNYNSILISVGSMYDVSRNCFALDT